MKFLEEQINKTTSSLTLLNWSCIGAMIVLLLSTSVIKKFVGFAPSEELSTKLYIAAIAVGVIAIPLANRIYSKRISRIDTKSPTEASLRIYRVAFITKLLIVCAAFLINLTLFFFANNTYLLIIGAIYIVYQMIAVQSKEGVLEIIGINPEVTEETA